MAFFRTENLRVELREDGLAQLWIEVPGKKVNAISRAVLGDFEAALNRVAADASIKQLVLRSAKESGFIAGADLDELARIRTPEEARALSSAGQRLGEQLANLPMPTTALIHGYCLGGGLEIALACDYRALIDQPGTQLGLPEIELGLLPAWGGTQRLPRVVGLERALAILLQRQRPNGRQAINWGLVDDYARPQEDQESFLRKVADRARTGGKRKLGTSPLRSWRQRLLESTALGRQLIFRRAEQILRRRVPEDMPAPFEALEAVRIGLTQGMTAGLAFEREAVGRLVSTPACRNLLTLHFQMEKARNQGKAERESAAPPFHRIGVVGAGTMGAGIAQVAALKGFEVVIQEVNEAALKAGVRKIEDLFQKAVERRLLSSEEAQRKLAGVRRTTSWEEFAHLDLVIEAVVEDLEKKREVFRELDRRTPPQTVLATNTSSLLVRQLQEGLNHPQRVAGLHFFNPVHKMPLIEVVRAPLTDEALVPRLSQWAATLGKTPVTVGDSPGFVVNRILMPYLTEAGLLITEGMAVEQVDRIMRRFGMPMGPLELLDQVGLDIAAHIAGSLKELFGDRLPSIQTLEVMVQRGWLGQKSGKGFYLYRGKTKKVNPAVGTVPPGGSLGKVQNVARNRMVLPMVNEAAACLAEGLAASAEEIDLAMVLGTGWAPHRGGPLRYAQDRGLPEIVKTLEDLATRYSPRFEPCPDLRMRSKSGQSFFGNLA